MEGLLGRGESGASNNVRILSALSDVTVMEELTRRHSVGWALSENNSLLACWSAESKPNSHGVLGTSLLRYFRGRQWISDGHIFLPK